MHGDLVKGKTHTTHVKTLLNHVEKQPGFVYKRVELVEPEGKAPWIRVEVVPRRGSKAKCSGCGVARPGYDRLKERAYQFVPLWNIAVFFLYASSVRSAE